MASDSTNVHLSKGTLLGSSGWLPSNEEIKLPVLVFCCGKERASCSLYIKSCS